MVRETSFYLPVKDEACNGPLGNYYLYAYDVAGPYDPHVHQISLGKDPLAGSADALTKADEFIDDLNTRDRFDFHQDVIACGASVIRLCASHDEFVLEVVDKVLRVMPGQQPRDVVPKTVDNSASDLPNIYTRLVATADDKYSEIRDAQRVYYLPREDYAATSQPHASLVVNTGGRSFPARFGILGGEETVEFQPAQYIDLD